MGGGAKRKDPAWKYGTQIEVPGEGAKKGYIYLQCNFCNKRITGGVKRLKDHLGGTHRNVGPCGKVPDDVKKECLDHLKGYFAARELAQRNMEEMIGNDSYFGGHEDAGSCHPSSASTPRVIRGPMDRFVANTDEDENKDSQPIPPASAKELRNATGMDIARFFYENGFPFNAVRSASFLNMVRSIGNFGRGLKPPTMYELRTWMLDEEVNTTKKWVDEVKRTWPETGVTIMSDGWSDNKHRGIINFLVNNPYGTVFLKSVDASAFVKDAPLLFNMLDEIVEEVGGDIVVQVVTDNASAYKAAGRMLMEKRKHLYWTPCAAHCIDLMLEKLGQLTQLKYALLKAKTVSKFIYNHSWVLSLMRKFSDKEILRPAVTRFATAFLTLQRLKELRQPLERMFASEEWENCSWAKKAEGKQVKKIVSKDDSFWRGVNYALKITGPLVKVLRMVDGERAPAMGFIYEAMDRAKEEIAKELGGQESAYKEIWDIIDDKWERQLHHDLHAAGYYLNPQFHYDKSFQLDKEINTGLYNCMDRLVPSEDYMKVDNQLEDFHLRKGMFNYKAAQLCYKTRSPDRWWSQFGDDVPELKALTMKVLSLTCSASGCECNWSTFNQVNTKKRNRISVARMNKLVYVMYNKKLKDRHIKLQSRKDDAKFDPLTVKDISLEDEWLSQQKEDEEIEIASIDDVDDDDDDDDIITRIDKAIDWDRSKGSRTSRGFSRRKQSGAGASKKSTRLGGKKKMAVTADDDDDDQNHEIGSKSDSDEDTCIRYDNDSFDSDNPNIEEDEYGNY